MLEDYDKATSEKILGHALVYASPELNFTKKMTKILFSRPKLRD